jgi:hypothetical protein
MHHISMFSATVRSAVRRPSFQAIHINVEGHIRRKCLFTIVRQYVQSSYLRRCIFGTVYSRSHNAHLLSRGNIIPRV